MLGIKEFVCYFLACCLRSIIIKVMGLSKYFPLKVGCISPNIRSHRPIPKPDKTKAEVHALGTIPLLARQVDAFKNLGMCGLWSAKMLFQ